MYPSPRISPPALPISKQPHTTAASRTREQGLLRDPNLLLIDLIRHPLSSQPDPVERKKICGILWGIFRQSVGTKALDTNCDDPNQWRHTK
jgi:hypothetical protein